MPVSLIGTFAVFPLLGFSINTLSLFGLVLAIGLVVDDAIVVVEAVEHHIEEGMAPREATLKAMEEVSGPVVSIALILASVFIPVGVHERHPGAAEQAVRAHDRDLGADLGVQRADAVAGARGDVAAAAQAHARGCSAGSSAHSTARSSAPSRGYVSVSHTLIRKAFVGVALLAGFAVARRRCSAGALPTSFVPEEDYGYFLLNVQLPAAASLQRTDDVCKKVDDDSGETRRASQPTTRSSASAC